MVVPTGRGTWVGGPEGDPEFSPYCFLYLSVFSLSMDIIYSQNKYIRNKWSYHSRSELF